MKTGIPRPKKVSHDLSVSRPFLVYGSFRREISDFHADAHFDVQIGVILSGGMEVIYNDYRMEIRAGQFYLSSSWEPHACRVSRPNTASLVVTLSLAALSASDIIGEVEWAKPFFVPAARRPSAKDTPLRLKLHRIAKELYRLEQKHPPYCKTRQWQGINELLFLIINSWQNDPTKEKSQRGNALYTRIAPAVELARISTDRALSLDEAAAVCGLGKSAFAHTFTNVLGTSFGKFALRMRLSSASVMLKDPSIPIKEIAAQSGFNGLSNFYHAFLKEFGCTPIAFRRREK